jgi:hypothetical protein
MALMESNMISASLRLSLVTGQVTFTEAQLRLLYDYIQ